MKKTQLYYLYLLAGAIVFLVLLFPNIVSMDADTEIGPLQRNLLIVFAVSYLLGMALIFRHFLPHSFKRLSVLGYNLVVDIKRMIRVHFERFWVPWIGAVFIIFPLAPLFDISLGFSIDWYNHLWLVGYYGEYFSAHGVMPAALNTNQTILIAYPTFYGHLLYATLGTLSAYVGANLAVRIGILVLWIMKFVLAYLATMEFSKDKALSIAIGIMICWEIYPLTNLYNRGALTEMFATGLLVVSFYAGLLAFYKRDKHQKMTYFFLAGFAASLSGMAHPITAFFGFMFLAVIFLVFAFWSVLGGGSAGKMVAVIAIVILISYVLGVLSPWAYATNVFKDRLAITSFLKEGPFIFSDSIDHLLVRFSPFPFDKRSLYDGIHPTGGTPYLDAQINIPLLILAVVLVMNRQSAKLISTVQVNKQIGASVFWVSIVLFVVSTSLSMSPLLYRYIPILKSVQIAYRMVTYQNLSIAAAVISLLLMQRHSNLPRNFKLITLAVCLTLAGNGLLMKFWHIHAIANTVPAERQFNAASQNRNNFLNVPNTFYGLDAYTLSQNPLYELSNALPSISVNLRLEEDSFGKFEGQSFFTPEEMWVQTNVAFSPWNEILIDSSPAQITNDINNDHKMDALVASGKHYISARFAPDPTFQSLRRISNLSFAAWTFMTIAWLLFSPIRKFLRLRAKA